MQIIRVHFISAIKESESIIGLFLIIKCVHSIEAIVNFWIFIIFLLSFFLLHRFLPFLSLFLCFLPLSPQFNLHLLTSA